MSRPMSDAAFKAGCARLLDGFEAWALDGSDAQDAQYALNYKQYIGDDRLNHWDHDDIEDLFLDYLPQKVILDPNEASAVAANISRFLEYLEVSGKMARGSDPAQNLVDHIEDHLQQFLALMADPEGGSWSKRMVMAMQGDGVDFDDQASIDDWIERFNSGPIEERDAILGPLPLRPEPEEPEIVLPPRSAVNVEAARSSATEAPIHAKLTALAEYLGEGHRLTDRGNLKLLDARALVELLETEDMLDLVIGDRVFKTRTAANLIWLDMIVWWARQVGAVKVRDKRMSMTKAWQKRAEDPLVVMGEAVDVLFETGPLFMLLGDRRLDELNVVMDAKSVALLARVYEEQQPVEDLVDMMTDSLPSMISLPSRYVGGLTQGEEPYLKERVRMVSQRMVRVMEMAGLLVWHDGTLVFDRWGERSLWHGGALSITPFGEWVVQNYLTETGMVIAPVLATLGVDLDDPPKDIVVALAEIVPAGAESLAQAWEALGGWEGLPEQLWRVDRPQTEILLETLGYALPDKATAKAARNALLKHRSWIARRK